MSNTHPCPTCGKSILGNRWLCHGCWDQIPRADQHRINARFFGSAEDYLAVEATLNEYAKTLRTIASTNPRKRTA